MVIFGLILLLVGVLLGAVGIFGSGYDRNERDTTEIWIVNMDPAGIFILGMVAATLIVVGVWVMKVGAHQGRLRRKEHKRIGELSEKLNQVEAERRREQSDRDDKN